MLIKEKPLQHWIDHFYGYGSWQARTWFVAHEEGGGDLPEEVADKLDYFYETHASVTGATLCDIRDLYKHITARLEGTKAGWFNNFFEYRFDSNAILHGVWKNLIAFVHGYRNEPPPDPLEYQKNLFVLPSAHHEALIRLYPLPSPHNHAWYYSWLDVPQLPFLKSRRLYQEHLYHRRLNSILQNINNHQPEVVLMYGMENIAGLRKSIHDFFPSAKFKMAKAVKQLIPQHHRTDVNRTTIIITSQIPALRHNRIETGFDWREFGKTVNQ